MKYQINKNKTIESIECDFKELIDYTSCAMESVNDLNIFWNMYENYFPPYSEFFGNINIKLIEYFNNIYESEYNFINNVKQKETNHVEYCLKIKEKNTKLMNNLKDNINLFEDYLLLQTLKNLIEDLIQIDNELTSAISSNY